MLDLGMMFGNQRQTSFDGRVSDPFQGWSGGSNALQRLGDLFSMFTQFGRQWKPGAGSSSPPAATPPAETPAASTPAAPEVERSPFGSSITGGTLGSMLSRRPVY